MRVARKIAAERRNRFVELRRRDWASFDGAQTMRPGLEVTDLTLFDVELSAIAISPRLAGDGWDVAIELDLAGAAQHFAQDGALGLHLEFVGGVLVLAPPPTPPNPAPPPTPATPHLAKPT